MVATETKVRELTRADLERFTKGIDDLTVSWIYIQRRGIMKWVSELIDLIDSIFLDDVRIFLSVDVDAQSRQERLLIETVFQTSIARSIIDHYESCILKWLEGIPEDVYDLLLFSQKTERPRILTTTHS